MYLRLRFFGDELDPDAITALLGIEATTSLRKGDVVVEGKRRRAHTGMWLLDCERITDTVDNQIKLLFGDLTDDLEVWQSLANIYIAELKCHLFLRTWNRATILSADTVEAVAARGLRLHFDVYMPQPIPLSRGAAE